MAANDPVVQIIREIPPAASSAAIISRAGGSTPAENVVGHAFDAASDEYMDFLCRLHGYDGGGLTLVLAWTPDTATSGNCDWEASIRAIPDDAEDLDGSHTYVANGVIAASPNAAGEVGYDSITFTDGADMDSLADGELFILRIMRDANDATNDTMTGDAQLWDVLGYETA